MLTILRILCISEQLVLEQAAVVFCLALVTCMMPLAKVRVDIMQPQYQSKHLLTAPPVASCTTPKVVRTGRDGPLQQLSSLPLLLRCK